MHLILAVWHMDGVAFFSMTTVRRASCWHSKPQAQGHLLQITHRALPLLPLLPKHHTWSLPWLATVAHLMNQRKGGRGRKSGGIMSPWLRSPDFPFSLYPSLSSAPFTFLSLSLLHLSVWLRRTINLLVCEVICLPNCPLPHLPCYTFQFFSVFQCCWFFQRWYWWMPLHK